MVTVSHHAAVFPIPTGRFELADWNRRGPIGNREFDTVHSGVQACISKSAADIFVGEFMQYFWVGRLRRHIPHSAFGPVSTLGPRCES